MFGALAFVALLLSANYSTPKSDYNFRRIAEQADVARTADRVEEAIALYRKGVRLHPSWSEGWWWLGSLFYDEDRFSDAHNAFKHFVEVAPKPAPAYAFLALCEYEIGDYAEALGHFQKWARLRSPGTSELIDVAGFHWALLLTRNGRFIEALYLLAAKAGKLGRSPALIEAMGLASLRMKLLPEQYPDQQREAVWLAGEVAFHAGRRDFARADEYAARLLHHYGSAPNVHYFRGTLLSFEDKPAEAAEEFLHELRLSPQHAAAMIELARIDLDEDKLDEALPLTKRAVNLEPKNPEAHHMLGRVLLAARQFVASAEQLELAKQLAPDSASIRFQLAAAYRKLGRREQAEKEQAAFDMLKDMQEALVPPEEKLQRRADQPSQPQ